MPMPSARCINSNPFTYLQMTYTPQVLQFEYLIRRDLTCTQLVVFRRNLPNKRDKCMNEWGEKEYILCIHMTISVYNWKHRCDNTLMSQERKHRSAMSGCQSDNSLHIHFLIHISMYNNTYMYNDMQMHTEFKVNKPVLLLAVLGGTRLSEGSDGLNQYLR